MSKACGKEEEEKRYKHAVRYIFIAVRYDMLLWINHKNY
jgi:hypothetical protein